MKAREYQLIVQAVEEGVRFGVRRAYKHSEHREPDEHQMSYIADEVVTSICNWFTFDQEPE